MPAAKRSRQPKPAPATRQSTQQSRRTKKSCDRSSDSANSSDEDKQPHDSDGSENDDEDKSLSDEDKDQIASDCVLPTLANYSTVGAEWTDTYIEKLLASRKIGSNNRPSHGILSEAQALRDTFHRTLKMLSLAGNISFSTLKAALFLGPTQRATTSYDTYRAYSKKNTKETAMPPRNTHAGFAPRNKVIGTTWTSLDAKHKLIFHPPLFKRLAEAVIQADTTQPSTSPNIEQVDDEDPLNPSDLRPYLPIFQQLVNMPKVEHHLERGSIGMPQNVQSEKKGRDEISKVVKQLRALHSQFQIEFHLLVSSFHPKTTLSKALWMEEYTTCDRWAQLMQSEHHLLENFAKEATQCPSDVFKKKPSTNAKPLAATEQNRLRQELTSRLNQLVETQLPYAPRPGVDIHPKGPKSDVMLSKKKFLQSIHLKVHRTEDCLITDAMLEKGAAPGNMTLQEVRLWLKEIADKKYTVVSA